MFKNIFKIIIALFFVLNSFSFGFEQPKIEGRWMEKISQRVVADIIQKNKNEYQIFITWREDNLAQKDIYRFIAKKEKDNILSYKNAIHIYRYFEKDKIFDETDYIDGSGTFEIKGDEITWHDAKDREDSSFIRANEELIKDTTIKNSLFQITLIEELRGFYKTKTTRKSILIYDKNSKKNFVEFRALKKNALNSFIGEKLGELREQNKTYDIVLIRPKIRHIRKNEAYGILYDICRFLEIKPVK